MAAVLEHRPDKDAFFRRANAIRELPIRLFDRINGRVTTARPSFSLDNFTLLEQSENQELAFGLAGKFWQSDYGQASVTDAKAFQAFNEPGAAKLVLNYHAEKLDEIHTRLTTGTRVFCLDKTAQRKVAPYWSLIKPVSGLIRQHMLKSLSRLVKERAMVISD